MRQWFTDGEIIRVSWVTVVFYNGISGMRSPKKVKTGIKLVTNMRMMRVLRLDVELSKKYNKRPK